MRELIIAEPRRFFAYKDEKYFFEWLEGIAAVKSVKGTAAGLLVQLEDPIDDASLMDMIALLARYSLDKKCLKVLCTQDNERWFKDQKSYWFNDVFG